MNRNIWLDTRWGCGLITTNEKGIICDPVAPIFKKFCEQVFVEVVTRGRYKYEVMICEKIKT